ncbi:MAG: GDP-mannose 4,6-dehydratase [Candidatus Omnitrophica bacterium]|nr:GDP-mannose 4,6-dehydratase [Candidatus Omnitrophota bacterium]
MKVLVTGGAGFIGSNFVKYLHAKYPKYHIAVLDALTYAGDPANFSPELMRSPRFRFFYGNIRNANLVDKLMSESDLVVHLAAETHVARSIYDDTVFFETDVMGSQVLACNLLRHRKRIERFIHISTSEVYGTATADPMSEEHPLNPTTPYAGAKCGADRLMYSYAVTYKLPIVILRPFNQYGPSQHLQKVIPRFITSAVLDRPLTVHCNCNSSRDCIFVKDTCQAIDQAMHAELAKIRGEVIKIGTGRDESIADVAERILGVMKKPKTLITHIGERPGQVKRHISSVAKSKKLLGWKAETSFNEGLRQTVEWYQNNRAWWEKLLWMRTVPILTESGKVEQH